jgi:hypothetical protein
MVETSSQLLCAVINTVSSLHVPSNAHYVSAKAEAEV